MKEIYRSFEGKIGTDCRWGYIVYDAGNVYEVREIDVYNNGYTFLATKDADAENYDSLYDARL